MSAEATTLQEHNVYRITAAGRRLLDPTVAVVVDDGGSAIDAADVEFIDYLTGKVYLVPTYAPSGAITVDANYLPVTTICDVKEYSVSFDNGYVDATKFCSGGAMARHKTLRDATGTLGILSLGDEAIVGVSFDSLFGDGNDFILEIDPDGTGDYVRRLLVKISQLDTSASPDALVETEVGFSIAAKKSVEGYDVSWSWDMAIAPGLPKNAAYVFSALDIDGDGSNNDAYSNSDPIDEWYNKGTRHPDNATSSGTERPLLVTSWTNSKPALDFDGAADFVTVADSQNDMGFLTGRDWTLVVVLEAEDLAAEEPIMASLGTGVFSGFYCSILTTGAVRFASNRAGNNKSHDTGTGVITVDTPTVLEIRANDASSVMHHSTALAALTAMSTSTHATVSVPMKQDVTIGRYPDLSNWFNGQIAFVGVWPRALNTRERAALKKYINAIWGL
jgi:hypothetical protein